MAGYPLLSIVMAQNGPNFAAGVVGLAAAVDRYEAIGGRTEIILVGDDSDAMTVDFLRSVGGAQSFGSDGTFVKLLAAGLEQCTSDLIWVGGNAEPPTPESIVWLMTAMEYSDCAMVRPDRNDAANGILRSKDLEFVRGLLASFDLSATQLIEQLTSTFVNANLRVSYRLEPRTAVTPGASVHGPGMMGTINGGDQRNIMLGPNTYSAAGVIIQTWGPTETIVIGDYSMFGDQSRILHSRNTGRFVRGADGKVRVATPEGGHRPETATSYPTAYIQPDSFASPTTEGTVFSAPVSIGSDVWLGYGSLVAGANIGHGAITQPGSVLTQNVPPYAIVGGNPAQLQRMRFSEPIVEKLLEIRWWDWSIEKIRSEIDWFKKPVSEFVERFADY